MDDLKVPDWGNLIGVPFAYGGRGPDVYDCYGLLLEMHRRQGFVIPDFLSPRDDGEIELLMNQHKSPWVECARTPGASVLIRIGRHFSHVGFMVDQGRMLHVWQRSGGVCVERLDDWRHRIGGFYRFSA